MALLVLVPAAVGAKAPAADFGWAPGTPAAGQPVVLTATTTAPALVAALWDFDGDSVFDALGTSVTTTFASPGAHPVALQVVDPAGKTANVAKTVDVGPPLPPPPVAGQALAPPAPAALMTPFPVVRLQGRLITGGILVTRFTIHAPAGAAVRVTCMRRGHGCPSTPSVAVSRSATRAVRIRRFERRLRAGAIVQVYVSDPHAIGKYTRFRVRGRGAPVRRDLCVPPAGVAPARCPGG